MADVALVTGGSRGIGRAIAAELAAQGWRVAVTSRSEDDLRRTAADLGALAVPADVTDGRAVVRAVETVERELGPVALLVANAATARALGPAWEVDPADWWADVAASLLGSYLCIRAVLPGMVERGAGRVVLVSSYVGVRPSPNNSAYGAAKAGLVNLAETLAAETSCTGVSVFAATPGRVRTAMTERMLETGLFPFLDEGEWLEPERAARLVAFLGSGRADALAGRFVHALDDVEELVRRADEIERDDLYVPRLRRLGDP
jgi:NAD(P)-dependent dehydrogenase (short-subunit alcohol dehydrogenase family)